MTKQYKRIRRGLYGEKLAKRILRKHFTNLRFHSDNSDPFDYTGIHRLTGDRMAIEIKLTTLLKGKFVHIETDSMNRKLEFLHRTNRKGIVFIILRDGETRFYFAKLQQHISKGAMIEVME